MYFNEPNEPLALEGLESLSEISSKYTERSSIAVKSPRTKMENFLEPQSEENKGRKTLVLDLDETLVHSTFNPPKKGEGVPDMVINVEWDNGERDKVFVRVRPYTYKFLAKMSKIFEIVIFTASILNYAKPLIYKLDKKGLNFQILSRAQWTLINNWYYKDLSRLGRDLKNVIMIDNSPQAYSWQRENGIPIISWFGNARDSQLNKLIPVLQRLAQVEDVREIIPNIVGNHSVNYYEAFKALKAPRESSPLDDFLNTLTRLKREAAAFFSGNELNNNLTEENKDSQENHEEETKK